MKNNFGRHTPSYPNKEVYDTVIEEEDKRIKDNSISNEIRKNNGVYTWVNCKKCGFKNMIPDEGVHVCENCNADIKVP